MEQFMGVTRIRIRNEYISDSKVDIFGDEAREFRLSSEYIRRMMLSYRQKDHRGVHGFSEKGHEVSWADCKIRLRPLIGSVDL